MEKYRFVRNLSESSASRVNLAETISTRKLVVIKEILSLQDQQEAKLLAELSHPNIIKLVESFGNFIVAEYCEGGDLSHGVHSLSSGDTKEIIVQVFLAVKYLHDKNILHRDLKLRNIFVTSRQDDRIFRIKVGDFGIARRLESSQMATTMIGTPYYLSPELCASLPYDKSVDIWSIGCVIYEILTRGRHPFSAKTLEDLLGRIQEEPVDYSGIVDPRMIEMLRRTLCKNPRDRLTIDGLLQLPVIQEYIQDFVNKINHTRIVTHPVASPPATATLKSSFSLTTDELLNTMRTCIATTTPCYRDKFDSQISQAMQCLKFIAASTDSQRRLQKETDRIHQQLGRLLILPSRINRFLDSVRKADYTALKELGDDFFLKEVIESGLVGDAFVMQEMEQKLLK